MANRARLEARRGTSEAAGKGGVEAWAGPPASTKPLGLGSWQGRCRAKHGHCSSSRRAAAGRAARRPAIGRGSMVGRHHGGSVMRKKESAIVRRIERRQKKVEGIIVILILCSTCEVVLLNNFSKTAQLQK